MLASTATAWSAAMGSVPVVPVRLNDPPIVVPSTAALPVLPDRVSGPEIESAAQPNAGSSTAPPISTNPVLLETVTGPPNVPPQNSSAVVPVAFTGPATLPPCSSTAPPALTVSEPDTVPVISSDWPDFTVTGALFVPEMVDVNVTVCVIAADVAPVKLPSPE